VGTPKKSRTRLWIALAFLVVFVAAAYIALAPGRFGATGSEAVPARVAGVLKEFPVDTASTPARPTSVVTQNLRAKSGAPSVAPASWFPKGVSTQTLAQAGPNLTSARYQPGSSGAAVNVHVLEKSPGPNDAARQIADQVASAAGNSTRESQVAVQSPLGGKYQGWKLVGPNGETYVLDKLNAPAVILIYSPQAAGNALADRLAANVGNGQGLLDYSETRGTLTALPAKPPAGFVLEEMAGYNTADLLGPELRTGVGADMGVDVQQLAGTIQKALPPHLTTGKYSDGSNRTWNVVVGDYSNFLTGMLAWYTVRAALVASGAQTTTTQGGLTLNQPDGTYGILHQGSRMAVVRGVPGAPAAALTTLAQALIF
jgi:hypothetical protein